MRFGPPDKKKREGPNPFAAITEANMQPVGPGIAVPREAPGIGKPPSDKRRRPFAQALGDTPPRDGPFAQSSMAVARQFPPKTRVHQNRRKSTGLDPYKPSGGVSK